MPQPKAPSSRCGTPQTRPHLPPAPALTPSKEATLVTHLHGWLLPALAALLLGFPASTAADTHGARQIGYGQVRYEGHGPEWWANRSRAWHTQARAYRRELMSTRRVLMQKPDVVEAINLACATYGYCATLWRKARCETGGTFSPWAHNPSGASGLFQFLPSTWASTPYAQLSIWSPYANALAAGWMHTHGRGGEWSCQ